MANIAITHRESDRVTLISVDGVTLTKVLEYEVKQVPRQQPVICIHYHDDMAVARSVHHHIDALLIRTVK